MPIKPIFVVIPEQYDSIECNFYSTIAGTAYTAALNSAFTGQWYATGGAALIGGAAQLTAQLAGCNDPAPPSDFYDDAYGGHCWKCNDTSELLTQYREDGTTLEWPTEPMKQILSSSFTDRGPATSVWNLSYLNGDGEIKLWSGYGQSTDKFGLDCDCAANDEPLPPHPPRGPISNPYEVDDGTCRWSVQATDSYVDDAGFFHVYYVITAVGDTDGSCGGPFSYWSTKNGPSWRPVAPGPNPPTPPPGVDPNPPLPTPPDYGDDFDEIGDKLDEIKECACREPEPPKPCLDGDWVSTRWVSDSPSPGGTKPLRKLFRYRSKSTRDNDELQSYWSSFIWQAGSVCVIHKGAWWGTPQVWAASADEGKRVIRFAAGEAGIDPDQAGEWITRNASSSRVGMSGRMRLAEEQGEQWVTRREGASGLPEL